MIVAAFHNTWWWELIKLGAPVVSGGVVAWISFLWALAKERDSHIRDVLAKLYAFDQAVSTMIYPKEILEAHRASIPPLEGAVLLCMAYLGEKKKKRAQNAWKGYQDFNGSKCKDTEISLYERTQNANEPSTKEDALRLSASLRNSLPKPSFLGF